MLPLPILNVHLQSCSEDWQQMTPVAQGRHCASCQRTVLDFTTATQPDLEAARAASPDSRLCGRFRAAQLAQLPRLRRKLRRFLVALVLVCGLGLTSGEAWAQVRKAARPTGKSTHMQTVTVIGDDVQGVILEKDTASQTTPTIYSYVEQMPTFRGGREAMQSFLQKNLQWPKNGGRIDVEGNVFINFIVGKEGRLRGFKVLKGIHPLLDAEALRVARLLNGHFTPGKQNGRAVEVYYTVRVTLRRE